MRMTSTFSKRTLGGVSPGRNSRVSVVVANRTMVLSEARLASKPLMTPRALELTKPISLVLGISRILKTSGMMTVQATEMTTTT